WAGKRLPTAREFEWAARNGAKATKYPWGADAPAAGAVNSREYQASGAHYGLVAASTMDDAVTSLGLRHLAGNAREWTAPVGNATDRLAMGGSFLDAGLRMTAGLGDRLPLGHADDRTGFRCAMDQP